MEILLVVISTVFASCFCVPEYNITFHGNKTTWIKAVEHCADIGGVLYSKERDIRNQTGDTTVWSGKYEAFTPWALLWGCYVTDFRDRSNKIFTIRDSDLVECQTLCTDTQFFAVYGDKCNCLQTLESSSPIRCGSTKSLKVWKNRISNVGQTSPFGCNSTNTECLCMAAACVRPNLKLTPEHCDQPYRIVCDNGKAMSFSDIKETAYKFCDRQNSILRRYLTAQDICPNGTAQHWTSGWRAVHEYKVSYKDHPLKLDPLRCHMVTTKNTIGSDYVPCSEKLPFYCEIGGNTYDDVTSTMKDGLTDTSNTTAGGNTYDDVTSTMKDGLTDTSNTTAGAIGGTVSAILIIAIVVATGIFVYKRRRTLKESQMKTIRGQDCQPKPHSHEKETHSNGQYHEIEITAVDSSLAQPVSNNHEPPNTSEEDTNVYTRIVSNVFDSTQKSIKTENLISNPGYNFSNVKDICTTNNNVNKDAKVDKINVSDYDLATPMTDTEEPDLYTANNDYDHLNNVKKPEVSDLKIYDHLKNITESDPTYDHAGVTVREDAENYEHFNIEKKNKIEI